MNHHSNNTYIQEYYNKIKDKEIFVCKEMELCLENLIDDLSNDEFRFDTSEADLRIKYIENNCFHVKAPLYGKPLKLDLWEKAYITALFSYYMYLPVGLNDDGTEKYGWVKRFNESLMLIARKNAKTTLTAAIAASDLVLTKSGTSIAVASNDDNQSLILYNCIKDMKTLLDPTEKVLYSNRNIIKCRFNNNELFRLSERQKNLEGRNLARGFVDECNMMDAEAKVVNSIKQSTSAVATGDDLIIYLTSEGFVFNGFLDNLTIKSKKIVKKEYADDDLSCKRFLPWIYKADNEREIWQALDSKDPLAYKIWQKANPLLGTGKKITYIRQQLNEAREDSIKRIWVLNKDFNLKQSSSVSWLKKEYYNKDETFDLEDFRGCLCLGGLDMAATTDLTSLSLIFKKQNEEKLYIHNMNWIPSSKLDNNNDNFDYQEAIDKGCLRVVDGEYVDTSIVAEYCAELANDYGIRFLMIGYDQKFSKSFEDACNGFIDIKVVPQNAKTLSNSIKITEAFFKNNKFNLQNSIILKWCLDNASLMVDSLGLGLLVKKNNDCRNRIDAAVSLVIAMFIYIQNRTDFETAIDNN